MTDWAAVPADVETMPGTAENFRALARLLAGWKCCNTPNLCGAMCQDDSISDALMRAEREVRQELERLENSDG